MSDYSLVNFADAENGLAKRIPDVEGIEGRFTRSLIDSRDLGVSLFRYPANFRTPFSHTHKVQEEAYVVVEGSGKVRLGDEVRELKLWDVLRVAPETVRGFEAGPEGLGLVCVGGPRPAEGDGQLADAPWPE